MSVRVEKSGASVVLTVDRPAVRNAIDPDVVDRLEVAVEQVAADPSVRAVVLAGAGGAAFVSGADLGFLRTATDAQAREMLDRVATLLDRLEQLPVLVVAAVSGACLGGGMEILVATDVRVAEEHATFSFRHAAMGLSTAWGGTTRLARLVARGAAARLLLTAATVDAAEALRIGLVDEVVPRGSAVARALELGEAALAVSPRSLAAFKRTLRAAYGGDEAASRQAEREELERLWNAPDRLEALRAFFESRPPRW